MNKNINANKMTLNSGLNRLAIYDVLEEFYLADVFLLYR